MIRLSEEEFTEIVNYMRKNYGINLSNKRVLIECRMTKVLEKREIPSFSQYIRLMEKDTTGSYAGEMVNRLTTNYTYFFREPAHFTILEEKILPELIRNRSKGVLQIWCAGCATGEECYTLAMVLQDLKQDTEIMPAVKILGTDISQEALDQAEKGIYPMKALEKIPVPWQKAYCRTVDMHHFQVDDSLKYNIRFKRRNLMSEYSVNDKYDLIFCRNVMIYFNKESRASLVKRLEASLNPGGYLFTGHAELLSREETRLETVYPAVYKKNIDQKG